MKRLLQILRGYMEDMGRRYTLVLLDVDFFLRYCVRFSSAECARIMRDINGYLTVAFGNTAKVLSSEGDEFAVLLPRMSPHEGAALVERVRQDFRRQRFLQEMPSSYRAARISFSAGVVSCPEDGREADQVLQKAVTALFMAKAQRRNQVFSFQMRKEERGFSVESPTPSASRVLYAPHAKWRRIAGGTDRIGRVEEPVAGENAPLWEPQALAADEAGTLYIADQDSHQINGYDGRLVRRIAGDGVWGYAGDGGPATEARLHKPSGLWCRGGRLYIADTGNDVVRLVDLNGSRIFTFAGSGRTGGGGEGGPARLARLNKPGGVVTDRDGYVYIDDIANNVWRRVDRSGRIRRFAGSGGFGFAGDGGPALEADFQEIYGIGIDWTGERLYAADYGNNRIREIHLPTGRITTVAGCGAPGYSGDGGDPTAARLCHPVAVCGDRRGNLFIADAGNQAVRMIPAGEKRLYTLAGGIGIGAGEGEELCSLTLANPNGLAAYGNTLFLLDGANNRVCEIVLP